MPFNGDYYDDIGVLKNLMGIPEPGTGRPNDSMSPLNGDFYAGDGSVHNITELSGDGGSGAEGGSYVHMQTTAAAEWVIPHNLGRRYVSVTVYDTTGNILLPMVEFTSVSIVTLHFVNPVQGTAIISK